MNTPSTTTGQQNQNITFKLRGKTNKCINNLWTFFNSIPDEDVKNYYMQWVYNMTIASKKPIVWELQKFVKTCENTIKEIFKANKNPEIQELQEWAKWIFTHHFKDYLPKENTQYKVFLKDIWTKTVLLPETNFYFDDNDTKPVINERKKIKEILSMQYSKKILSMQYGDVCVRNASLFNAQWFKLRWWDFLYSEDHDYNWLQGTYYILNEEDSMRPVEWSQEEIPDSNGIQDEDNIPHITPQIRLKDIFVKAQALYKIENGQLIENSFL